MRSRNSKRRGLGCLRIVGVVVLLGITAFVGFLLTPFKEKPRHYPMQEAMKPATVHTAHHKKKHKSTTAARPEIEQPSSSLGEDQSEQPALAEKPAEDKPKPARTPVVKPAQPHSTKTPAVFPGDFARGDNNSPRIAVTFDAGASAKPTYLILDTLAKHHVHATFFLTGKWIEKSPNLVRRIVDEGHEIGNHTYDHKRLTTLNAGKIADEADKTEQLVFKLTGKTTKPLLRVPFGARDKRVEEVLADLGYHSIYWDVDSWDSVKKGITADEIEERVLGKVRNGSIILMHCGSEPTSEALDSLLQKLSDAGYQQVTVSELMN